MHARASRWYAAHDDGLTEAIQHALAAGETSYAVQLGIAPTTVKTHLKHLYQKLQVSTRRQAVAQGQALGLLTHR